MVPHQGPVVLNRQEGGNSIADTFVCATGGLTQKQSLRGLLLRHLKERSWGRELSFCHVDGVIFVETGVI